MGLRIGIKSSSHYKDTLTEMFTPLFKQLRTQHPKIIGNPVPTNFTLELVEKIGDLTLVIANYPDCANFEGRKVMVFREFDPGTTVLDPHFFTTSDSPIARFIPTPAGIKMAKQFCYMLAIGHTGNTP